MCCTTICSARNIIVVCTTFVYANPNLYGRVKRWFVLDSFVSLNSLWLGSHDALNSELVKWAIMYCNAQSTRTFWVFPIQVRRGGGWHGFLRWCLMRNVCKRAWTQRKILHLWAHCIRPKCEHNNGRIEKAVLNMISGNTAWTQYQRSTHKNPSLVSVCFFCVCVGFAKHTQLRTHKQSPVSQVAVGV